MRNLHQAYYKNYFKGLDFRYLINDNINEPTTEIKRRNKDLTSPHLLKIIEKQPTVNQAIPLKVAYPGLVTGIGINHEAKITGEFKLGVHFDWTWGMPVVYGSSVKGVIRSAFKDGYVDASLIDRANAKKGINESDKVPAWVGDDANEQAIIDGIFEGKDSNGKNLSIYNRDIFFDAVITEADPKDKILCSDSITPHDENPLKNPIPITFLKIAPGCELEFRFKLHDSDFGDGKIFTAAQKKALFEEILKTVGVGAKTNVGYGQLDSVSQTQNQTSSAQSIKQEEVETTGKLIRISGLGYKVRISDAKYSQKPYDLIFKSDADKNKITKKTELVNVVLTLKNNKVVKVIFKSSI